MADHLDELVRKLSEAHGDNLKSIVLYGSAVARGPQAQGRAMNILVVVDQITPGDLKAAHDAAEEWRLGGNPLPIYFTSEEVIDSSDVFPMEFIDMSRSHRVVYGKDPFEQLDIQTYNLRHQLEYELRGKLIRLRTLYIPASNNPNRLAQLMADSLDSFAVLFRHVLSMFGSEAPFEKRDCVMKLSQVLNLDEKVLARIFDYSADEDEMWRETETNELFAAYLVQIKRVIDAVNRQ